MGRLVSEDSSEVMIGEPEDENLHLSPPSPMQSTGQKRMWILHFLLLPHQAYAPSSQMVYVYFFPRLIWDDSMLNNSFIHSILIPPLLLALNPPLWPWMFKLLLALPSLCPVNADWMAYTLLMNIPIFHLIFSYSRMVHLEKIQKHKPWTFLLTTLLSFIQVINLVLILTHSLNHSPSLQPLHLFLKTKFICHLCPTCLSHCIDHACLQPVDWRLNNQMQQRQQQQQQSDRHLASENFANNYASGSSQEEPLRSSFIYQQSPSQPFQSSHEVSTLFK